MGTGGGEYLLSLAELLPPDTVATEGWAPTVDVARRNVGPLGIKVIEYGAPDEDVDSVSMPFPDGRFDLVLNRHESFSPRELARVLTSGGQFVTQQVGGAEAHELGGWFGEHRELPHVNLTSVTHDLARAGFSVLGADQHVGAYVFQDVAALLAYLQLVPWVRQIIPPGTHRRQRPGHALPARHRSSTSRPARRPTSGRQLRGRSRMLPRRSIAAEALVGGFAGGFECRADD